MKKLLFVIPTMMVAGAEKSLLALLHALDKNKYSIDLLLFAKRGELLEELPKEINVYEVDKVTRSMIMEFKYYFKDLIKSGNFGAAIKRLSIVLIDRVNMKQNKVIFNSWFLKRGSLKQWNKEYDVAIAFLEGVTDYYVIEKVQAKKKIGWVHRNYTAKPFDRKFDLKIFSKFDFIATISEKCLQTLKDEFVSIAGKFVVIPNIVSSDYIESKAIEGSEAETWPRDLKHLVTVGRLTYEKGIDIAIEAARLLKEMGVKFYWHFYGQGSDRATLEKQIHEKEVDNCCGLEGIRNNPYPIMKNADLIIQPSRSEGKSLVLDEAKCLKKVIVATNYSSVCDQITHKQTGVICEMNPKALAQAIKEVLEDQELQKSIEYMLNKEREDVSSETIKKFESLIT